MTPIRIAKTIALAGAVAGMAPAAALAASQVTFSPGVNTLPGYTTASVIQDFTGSTEPQFGKAVPAPIPGYTQSISYVGGSSARILTPTATQIQNGTLMQGQYLSLRNEASSKRTSGSSYTLSIDGTTAPIQFLSFVIQNYVASSSVVLNYVNGGNSGNILAGLSGLNPGSSGEVIVNNAGRFSGGISSVVFSISTAAGAPLQNFNLDNIAAAAPEPATWGMMLLGFGLAGAQLRRRRKAAPALA